MYWYLSFLRPPPVYIVPSTKSITITPQVANDLRTEILYAPTEIHYVWQRVFPDVTTAGDGDVLTVYQAPASTYRSLIVDIPSSARPGEKWRLGLYVPLQSGVGPSSTHILELSGHDVPIIGVWSDAIEIRKDAPHGGGAVRAIGGEVVRGASKRKGMLDGGRTSQGKEMGEAPKQGRIRREWTLPRGGELKIVEQTSFDLDKKIWDAGLAMSSWLWRYLDGERKLPHPLLQEMVDLLRGKGEKRLKILEVGSGTGLVSIALAQVMQALDWTRHGDSQVIITATDLESALPLMGENIRLNPALTPSSSISIAAAVLDWDEPLPSWVRFEGDLAVCPDLIIAADVTYNTNSFPALVKTLDALLHPATDYDERRPLLLMAYKQRDPGERELWRLLDERGVGMVQVDEVKGAEEEGRVELWVGR